MAELEGAVLDIRGGEDRRFAGGGGPGGGGGAQHAARGLGLGEGVLMVQLGAQLRQQQVGEPPWSPLYCVF